MNQIITGSEVRKGTRVIEFPGPNSRATIVDRPNRFVARVIMDGKEMVCHLHDPGRLKELIYPGNSVLVRRTSGLKTSHSITAALKDHDWILTDSRFHNRIAGQFLGGSARPEVTLGQSRIDFLVDGSYVEVKGCSLEENGVAKFPDAPSKRAVKHVRELISAVMHGGKAGIVILVFSPRAVVFVPNTGTDPEFSSAFYSALECGVEATALQFRTDEDGIYYMGTIPVKQRKN